MDMFIISHKQEKDKGLQALIRSLKAVFVDLLNNADIPIKNARIVIVSPVNNPIDIKLADNICGGKPVMHF